MHSYRAWSVDGTSESLINHLDQTTSFEPKQYELLRTMCVLLSTLLDLCCFSSSL